MRDQVPHAWFVGEMIHGDYPGYVNASGIDSVTQYELWKAIWSSLNDENLFELGHAVDRNNDMLETFVPATFVGNHDVTRIASVLSDERKIPITVALLFFLAGVPSVYYGDEQGFRGQGGAGWWRRRHSSRLPLQTRRSRTAWSWAVPAAPGVDRSTAAPSMAAQRANRGPRPEQRVGHPDIASQR